MSEDGEPIGSCKECGAYLYEGDDEYFCDDCLFLFTDGGEDGPEESWGEEEES